MIKADYNYKRRLKRFLKKFDIEPKDIDLYVRAFTHTSASEKPSESYEILEFLGDSIILAHVVDKLVRKYPKHKVGILSKAKSQIVSGETLAAISYNLKLDKYVRMDVSITNTHRKISPGIMADVFEALVGAIFQDQGYKKISRFLVLTLKDTIDIDLSERTASDYKSILQEEIQRRYKQIPHYEMFKSTGPDHDKTFYARVHFNGIYMGKGKGKCKKEAEQEAASNTLERRDHYFAKIDKAFRKKRKK